MWRSLHEALEPKSTAGQMLTFHSVLESISQANLEEHSIISPLRLPLYPLPDAFVQTLRLRPCYGLVALQHRCPCCRMAWSGADRPWGYDGRLCWNEPPANISGDIGIES